MKSVAVYFNLHRRQFTVLRNRRVAFYADELVLKNCKFVVQQGGRQRVIRTRRKNVHAFVVGEPVKGGRATKRVRYNPYKHSTFVNERDEPVLTAKLARFHVKGGRPEVFYV